MTKKKQGQDIDSLVSLAWAEHQEGKPVTAAEVAAHHARSPQSYAVHFSQMQKRGIVKMSFNRALDVMQYSVTDYGHQLLGASSPRVGDR